MRWRVYLAVLVGALAISSAAEAQRAPTYRPPPRVEPYRPPPQIDQMPRLIEPDRPIAVPPPPEAARPAAESPSDVACSPDEIANGLCTIVERLPSCPGDPRCPGGDSSTPPPR